jgi:hypothetical protein
MNAKELAAAYDDLRPRLQAIRDQVIEASRIMETSSEVAVRNAAGLQRVNLYEQAEKEFAKVRGWRVGGTSFGVRELQTKTRIAGRNIIYPPIVDHPTYFRDANGHCAAILSQPYGLKNWTIYSSEPMTGWVRGPWRAAIYAKMRGIGFEFPDLPSWHRPGNSWLLLWVRRDLCVEPFDLPTFPTPDVPAALPALV